MIGERFLQTDLLVRCNGPESLGVNFLPLLPDLTLNARATD